MIKQPFVESRNALRLHGVPEVELEPLREAGERALFAYEHILDDKERHWTVRPYQRASLETEAFRKVHCDGRDVGKTAEIAIVAAWAMATCHNTEMLIATQCENHLFPLMHRLARMFESTPEFLPCLLEIKRTPSWYLRFSNGFVLWGRIAGPRGINFQGLHVDWQIVDEAQEMSEHAWQEMYQALNGDGRRWVYGVPNGRRNTFYRLTQLREYEQYNWPSTLNPQYTLAKDFELAQLYGGRTSQGYINRVLGQHGEPAHAVFSFEDYLLCVDASVDSVDVHVCADGVFEAPEYVERGAYYLGCDFGYSPDPSEFVVYQAMGAYLMNVYRVQLSHVDYARQREIITELDRVYAFRTIGLDAGGVGRGVSHELMKLGEAWCEKVRAYAFGATIRVGTLPDGSPQERKTKEFMTELLVRRINDHTIVFPQNSEREAQYSSHTYRIQSNGHIIYEKGNDHIIDADRCAMLAHHEDTCEHAVTRPRELRFDTF
jgi:hypothetical protein